jgi:hypothetical protein
MKHPLIMLIFVLALVPSGVIAAETDSSGSVISEYPTHTCSAPPKPTEPGAFNGQQDVEQYNSEIADYNSKVGDYNLQIQSYRSCIREYISSAKNDIKKIKEKISEAIKEANSQ